MVRQIDRERQRACTHMSTSPPPTPGPATKGGERDLAELRKLYPDFTVQNWAGIHWRDDPTFNEQYANIVEGLRKAGLPEGEKKTD